MTPNVRQVQIDSWQGYQAIALVRPEPRELADRLGLEFEAGHDDLDETSHAGFEATSGRRFALMRHLHAPVGGTEILWDLRHDDLAEALVEALATLGIAPSEVEWVPQSRVIGVSGAELRNAATSLSR